MNTFKTSTMKSKRTLFIIIVLFSLPGYVFSQTNLEEDSALIQQSDVNYQSDTLIFNVFGMGCPGCEGGLEKQVDKITSVEFSDANWLKQELRIVLKQDSTLDSEALTKRVKKANFTLGDEKNAQ